MTTRLNLAQHEELVAFPLPARWQFVCSCIICGTLGILLAVHR